MEKKEMITRMKKRVKVVDRMLDLIKKETDGNNTKQSLHDLQMIEKRLNDICTVLRSKLNKMRMLNDGDGNTYKSEMNKNIYRNTKSFKSAGTRAGKIIKPSD
ncbi:MAG TPA: hypothetical protein DDX98_12840 [Bacteroidales bacterium]|nr:hypothetical protein [Bacteroidales bacterium]